MVVVGHRRARHKQESSDERQCGDSPVPLVTVEAPDEEIHEALITDESGPAEYRSSIPM